MTNDSLRPDSPGEWLRSRCLDDPRKTLLLVVLAVIAVAVIINGFPGGSSPRQVGAANTSMSPEPVTAPEKPATTTTIPGFDRRQRDEYLAQLDMEVERDLFSADYSSYPLVAGESADVVVPATPVARPSAEDAAAAAERRSQARIAALRKRAASLSLQSTMGATAIVNGKVVTAGQSLAGFKVKRVAGGECVLEAEGVEITLRMK